MSIWFLFVVGGGGCRCATSEFTCQDFDKKYAPAERSERFAAFKENFERLGGGCRVEDLTGPQAV